MVGAIVASFEKRAGAWRVVVRRGDVRESKTFPTKAQAQAWAVERERELADVAAGGVPRRTVREMMERYLAEVTPQKRGATFETGRLLSWLGRRLKNGEESPAKLSFLDLQVADLTAEVLGIWRDQRSRSVAPSTVLREMNLMGAVLTTARREWGWIKVSPMGDVRRPKSPQARTRRVSVSEADALCLALGFDGESVASLSHEVAVAFLLAIETAMRQGEILGLTWDRVDLARRVAHLPMTKNGSRRDVPLSTRAVELIELLRGRDDVRLVRVSSASCDALFRRARDRSGLADIHFHDSRREATSRLAKKVDVLTLARITGHKNIKELMTYYQTDMADVALQIG